MTDLVPISTFDLVPQAFDLAEKISKTEFVPTALRGRPEAIMACVLAGHEMGLSPLQALAKIHIIEGRPGPSAELMRAIVLREGHEIWPEDATTTRVTLCGRRAGSDNTVKVTWTLDDAKKAGLDGRQNWRKYPRAMLTARATGELVRMMFPDVLAGFTYAAEELEDGFDDFARQEEPAASPTAGKTRRAKAPTGRTRKASLSPAAPAAAPAPSVPLPGEGDVVDAVEVASSDAIDALVERMNALPDEDRKACKSAFVAKFGPPSDLAASDLEAASELVEWYEESAGSDPGGDGPPDDDLIDRTRVRDLAKLAGDVWPNDALGVARGQWGAARDRLRHALTQAVTGRTHHLDELTDDEATRLAAELHDLREGAKQWESTDEGLVLVFGDTRVLCPWVDAEPGEKVA